MILHTDNYQTTWTKDHFINVSCKQVDCEQFLNGWITRIPIDSPQEQYIKRDKTRQWIAVKVDDETMNYFFEAGQRCFRTHTVKLERGPYLTINQNGRESERLRRAHMDFDEWTTRFNESSYKARRDR
jgi:hypothetical protein